MTKVFFVNLKFESSMGLFFIIRPFARLRAKISGKLVKRLSTRKALNWHEKYL